MLIISQILSHLERPFDDFGLGDGEGLADDEAGLAGPGQLGARARRGGGAGVPRLLVLKEAGGGGGGARLALAVDDDRRARDVDHGLRGDRVVALGLSAALVLAGGLRVHQ